MFSTYDMKKYGAELRKIRKYLGLNQSDVRRISGLNEDTLTNLENGLVIPRYDTIEILSHVYKFDLMGLLFYFKNETNILALYEQLDEAITYNDVNKLYSIRNNLFDIKGSSSMDTLVQFSDFDMLLSYSESILVYYDKKSSSQAKFTSKNSLIETLKINNPDFSISSFKKFNYNFLELRMLLQIALFESDSENYSLSNSIMEFILKKMSIFEKYELVPVKFKLIIYFNLAYNYHNIYNHKKVYNYAVEGIELGKSTNDFSNLFFLYYRKGIAEYHLKYPDYMDSLRKSIYILDILDRHELKKLYIESTKKNYNIDIN